MMIAALLRSPSDDAFLVDLQLDQEQLGGFLDRILHERNGHAGFAHAGRNALGAGADARVVRARFGGIIRKSK